MFSIRVLYPLHLKDRREKVPVSLTLGRKIPPYSVCVGTRLTMRTQGINTTFSFGYLRVVVCIFSIKWWLRLILDSFCTFRCFGSNLTYYLLSTNKIKSVTRRIQLWCWKAREFPTLEKVLLRICFSSPAFRCTFLTILKTSLMESTASGYRLGIQERPHNLHVWWRRRKDRPTGAVGRPWASAYRLGIQIERPQNLHVQ